MFTHDRFAQGSDGWVTKKGRSDDGLYLSGGSSTDLSFDHPYFNGVTSPL